MTPKQARAEVALLRNRAEQSEQQCSSKAEMFERLYGPDSDQFYL